jgi:hypothetical protein
VVAMIQLATATDMTATASSRTIRLPLPAFLAGAHDSRDEGSFSHPQPTDGHRHRR